MAVDAVTPNDFAPRVQATRPCTTAIGGGSWQTARRGRCRARAVHAAGAGAARGTKPPGRRRRHLPAAPRRRRRGRRATSGGAMADGWRVGAVAGAAADSRGACRAGPRPRGTPRRATPPRVDPMGGLEDAGGWGGGWVSGGGAVAAAAVARAARVAGGGVDPDGPAAAPGWCPTRAPRGRGRTRRQRHAGACTARPRKWRAGGEGRGGGGGGGDGGSRVCVMRPVSFAATVPRARTRACPPAVGGRRRGRPAAATPHASVSAGGRSILGRVAQTARPADPPAGGTVFTLVSSCRQRALWWPPLTPTSGGRHLLRDARAMAPPPAGRHSGAPPRQRMRAPLVPRRRRARGARGRPSTACMGGGGQERRPVPGRTRRRRHPRVRHRRARAAR